MQDKELQSQMQIRKLKDAIGGDSHVEAQQIALSIINSQPPYPQSLLNHALSYLNEYCPEACRVEPLLSLSAEDEALIELVEENGWIFDHLYYAKSARSVFCNRKQAIHHYLNIGWRKGYNISRFFNTNFYLSCADVSASGIHPLIHYLEHGMQERRGTADPFDAMLRAADLIHVEPAGEDEYGEQKIGVFIHLYYPELATLIIPYLNNIPNAYDLYVSTRPEFITHIRDLFKSKCAQCACIDVRSFPNIGRDVAPLFCGFGKNINDYPIILKLHSKKSLHEEGLSTWLEHILDNLLGSTEIIKTILHQLMVQDTQIVYPIETLDIMYGIAKDSCWGHAPRNYDIAKPILDQWGVNVGKAEDFIFPAGTMFWCQSKVLTPLVERLIGISATKLINGSAKSSFLSWNLEIKRKDNLTKMISSYPLMLGGFEKVYHFSHAKLDQKLIRPFLNTCCLDIHWIIPDFQIGAGGHMTIFRCIKYLEKAGHKCTIWIHSLRQTDEGSIPSIHHQVMIKKYFQDIQANVFLLGGALETLDLISGDMVIATDRMSAYPALSMKNFLTRGYFIQDYESRFFATGSESYLTENTYASVNGFNCICASPWLHSLMELKYGNNSVYFPLAVNHKVYSSCDIAKKNFGQIAFYVRRSTPRRLFAIGLLALHELFVAGARFSLVVFGEEETPDLKIPVDTRYMGVLSGKKLHKLYSESYIGLVLSGTNYSLIPNEMMATGLPVVDIDAEHTRMSYQENTVLLADPNPKSIALKLKSLLEDKNLWKKHLDAGIQSVQGLTWESSFKIVEASIAKACKLAHENYPLKAFDANQKPLVTVVIPAYNGGDLLRECVNSILQQLTTFSFDILIVDSSSTDGSLENLLSSQRVRIKRIKQCDFGHGKTRNLAAELSESEYIAYLTQDAVPANKYWLQNLVRPMLDDAEIAGVFGAHMAHPFHSPLTALDMQNHFYNWLLANHSTPIRRFRHSAISESQDHERFYSDNNSCLRRAAWREIPYPDVAYGEDQLWAELILNAGFKKAFSPMAIVHHSHEYGFREALIRANTEWHFFKQHLGKDLPSTKQEVIAMMNSSVEADKIACQDFGLVEDRRKTHFARAAGYYLAAKGFGQIRP